MQPRASLPLLPPAPPAATGVAAAAMRPSVALMKALADENRLRIVALLAGGELCVCHIASALELSQPNASQHLTVLKNAGVVEGERRGSWIHYRLLRGVDPARDRVVDAVLEGLDAEGAEADRRTLDGLAGAVTCR